VEDAGVRVPEHALLGEGVLEGLSDAQADAVEARLGRAGEQHPNAAAGGEDEGDDGNEEKKGEDDCAGKAEEDALGG
jgi:hypothetical protein